MVTEEGENLKVIGIHGDFDDAQRALKNLLASPSFQAKLKEQGIRLSAANSVNFGRILFQILYHIHSYLQLLHRGLIGAGESIDLVVPSGNFGNALGAYYAKKMGLPIGKIVIASNANNILTELIQKGRYDLRGRSLIKTTSPAMDILRSSNVERVLFDKFGPQRTRELMEQLEREGFYELSPQELQELRQDFEADFVDDGQIKETIKEFVEEHNYLMDPHTATTIGPYRRFVKGVGIAYSTAEWTKFAPTVLEALTGERGVDDRRALERVAQLVKASIPEPIAQLFSKPIRHETVIPKEEIEEEILRFLDSRR
jgi:threonine synthase